MTWSNDLDKKAHRRLFYADDLFFLAAGRHFYSPKLEYPTFYFSNSKFIITFFIITSINAHWLKLEPYKCKKGIMVTVLSFREHFQSKFKLMRAN